MVNTPALREMASKLLRRVGARCERLSMFATPAAGSINRWMRARDHALRQWRAAGSPLEAAGNAGMIALPRRARLASLVLAIGLQAALIAVILGIAPVTTRPRDRSIAVFDIGATVSAASSVGPPQPRSASGRPRASSGPATRVAAPLPPSDSTAASVLEESAAADAGNVCDIGATLQVTLQSSDTVRASLAAIPAADRSVANAIMVWNNDWLTFDTAPISDSIAAIRDVIAQTIAGAAAECRLQPQIGPQLVLVAGGQGTTVLAFGSGTWRWHDLIESPSLDPPDQASGAIPPPPIPGVTRGVPPQEIGNVGDERRARTSLRPS
jgi:hypothetical protein